MSVLRRPTSDDPLELQLAGLPPAVLARAARLAGAPRRADVAQQLAHLRSATGPGLDAAIVLLCDGYGATVDRIAELLDTSPDAVGRHLVAGRAVTAPRAATSACAVWPLVARRSRLPANARVAVDSHLDRCSRCRTAAP